MLSNRPLEPDVGHLRTTPMTPEDVTEIIQRELQGELAGCLAAPLPHGIDLSRCLILPLRQRYEDSFLEGRTVELWLVLEENPEGESGYQIIFDERRRQFGLAVKSKGGRVFIGYHGSFLNTLEGM